MCMAVQRGPSFAETRATVSASFVERGVGRVHGAGHSIGAGHRGAS